MTLTVRPKPDLERKLEAVCKRKRATKSTVVAGLIEAFVAREPEASSYEIAARLGVIGSKRRRRGRRESEEARAPRTACEAFSLTPVPSSRYSAGATATI